jgi:arsenate reductase
MVFICYPKCSTCRKAEEWLQEKGIPYETRHIQEMNPTAAELRTWKERSGLPLKRFFNTSGLKYRELDLKDRLPEMEEEEQFSLLASDGMLVRRPVLVGEGFVLVGFREKEWEEALGK